MLYYREISEANFSAHLSEMTFVVEAGEGLKTYIGFHSRYGQHILVRGEGKFGLIEPDINPETLLKDAEDARDALLAIETREQKQVDAGNPSDEWCKAAKRLEWVMSFVRGNMTPEQLKRQNALESFWRDRDLEGVRWIS